MTYYLLCIIVGMIAGAIIAHNAWREQLDRLINQKNGD